MSAVVVGAGIAGLATALELVPLPTVVLSAGPLGDGAASAWAQGGVAAALGPGDDAAQHAADTLAAAGGIADPAIAALVASAAPGRIAALEAIGARFDRDDDGALRLGREGGHGRHRIVHAAGDGTGGEIMRALFAAARAQPSIALVEDCEAEELLTDDGAVIGVRARRGDRVVCYAGRVVLASGGLGGLYSRTSNPLTARGRGLALAARAGAALADLEFVQFHPTALDVGGDPMPLVTEALRGEGARLLDARGRRFMAAEHPLAELAPRDVVARAVARARRDGPVHLDAREAVGAAFPTRFPTVYAACRAAGIDPVRELVPIAPAAHYHMGGVAVDANGRSSAPGLWAVGEVAATGLHGANRLASNSLLEALVFAPRVAADIRARAPGPVRGAPATLAAAPDRADPAEFARLRALMTAEVGVVRDEAGLGRARDEFRRLRHRAAATSRRLADAALVAELVAAAALARRESRGGHFRADWPEPTAAYARRSRTVPDAITLEEIAA